MHAVEEVVVDGLAVTQMLLAMLVAQSLKLAFRLRSRREVAESRAEDGCPCADCSGRDRRPVGHGVIVTLIAVHSPEQHRMGDMDVS